MEYYSLSLAASRRSLGRRVRLRVCSTTIWRWGHPLGYGWLEMGYNTRRYRCWTWKRGYMPSRLLLAGELRPNKESSRAVR